MQSQARPSPLTLRTGVRYSATSRAFPFTVLITFCILGLGQRWGTKGLSQFGSGSQKLPRTCPTGIEPGSGTGSAGGEGRRLAEARPSCHLAATAEAQPAEQEKGARAAPGLLEAVFRSPSSST